MPWASALLCLGGGRGAKLMYPVTLNTGLWLTMTSTDIQVLFLGVGTIKLSVQCEHVTDMQLL